MENNKGLDLLLHFNKLEALGRIAFEAIDFGIPTISFNEGGIGECEFVLGLNDFVVDGNNPEWPKLILEKIEMTDDLWTSAKFDHANKMLSSVFSPEKYTSTIENLFS